MSGTGCAPKYKMPVIVEASEYTRQDALVEVEVNFSRVLEQLGIEGSFDERSVRLFEVDHSGEAKGPMPVQFEAGDGFDPKDRALGRLSWILEGWSPPHSRRSYELCFDIRENGEKEPPEYPSWVRFRGLTGDVQRDCHLEVEVGGALFTIYNFGHRHAHLYKPYFHPVLGPSGRSITQHRQFPGSLKGHYWHQGLFVAHQRVNGTSFWEERQDCGRQLHQEFVELVEGPVYGRFVARNLWRKPDGGDVLEDRRCVTIYNLPLDRRIMDFRLTLMSLGQPVTLEARPYNMLACRFADAMDVTSPLTAYDIRTYRESELLARKGGMVVNSEGETNVDRNHTTPGARAKWTDHSGLNGAEWEGLAIFDTPTNPRYPTYWLNWNNMTMAPSFTWAEPYTIPAGGELTLSYRIFIHRGDARAGRVAEKFNEYANPVSITVGQAERMGR